MTDVPSGSPAGRGNGIRRYLVGLALLGALPLIALNLYRVKTRDNELKAELRRNAFVLARDVAARLDDRIRDVDAMLLGLTVSLRPDVSDRARNDSLLQRAFAKRQGPVSSLYLIDRKGTLAGTSGRSARIPDSVGAFSQRGYFRSAKAHGGFVVGEMLRSMTAADSGWVVVFARAFTDSTGAFAGTVSTALRLDSLTSDSEFGHAETDPLITVFDSSGTMLSRSRDAAKFIGASRLKSPIKVDTSGVMAIKGVDGELRLTGFTGTTSAPWLVNVGVPQSTATAQVRQLLLQNLALLALAIALAILVGDRVGLLITRPIELLAGEARALARGAASTRTVLSGPREVRMLGDAFNQMAETVERRNASLADSERRYRLLFDSNPLPMWAWDAETLSINAVNEAALEKYGYTREAFLSLQILDLIDPSEHARFTLARVPFTELRHTGGTWLHRTATGERIEMEIVTTSSRRIGRASWLSVGIDVTARRAAERALAVSEEQLRQSAKMEAIGAFAGGISHDFNNLLTGMLGYCDLALDELDDQSPLYADISEIRTLALRGADLTKQILAVSRKQAVQPTLLDPNVVVQGMDRLLRRLIGGHIELETTLGHHVGTIRADAAQLEQVLLNLGANARDAMPNGGHLRIETRRVGDQSVEAYLLDPKTSWMVIAVNDSGHGMSDEVRQRIFEPFFTTKERGKGTGLGLALAYATVDQVGGAIRVESQLGVGTTFRLFFPTAADAVPARALASQPDAPRHGTETILFAEDEDSVRAVAVAALQRHGYRVLSAANGEDALLVATEFQEHIDLLLTDAVMPRMNGRELAEKVMLIRPTIRVLFASGYTDDESLLRGIRTDELSFLQKPFTATDLVRRVRSVLDAPTRSS